ncbi:HTH_Tnp_Tc3_2 domain-containing protein [Trichonephila clavipes]|nr:HTH_Tnp_Tc3_2 domain-containing protein [Trichonephila clavipes]
MGRSNASIRRCWQRLVDNGKFQRRDGSGRSRATADRKYRLIVRSVVQCLVHRPQRSDVRFAHECPPETIHRRLMELQWCLNRSGWNHADWGRIVFSDELRFQLCPDDSRRRVWRHQGSMPILLSLLHAKKAHNLDLWISWMFRYAVMSGQYVMLSCYRMIMRVHRVHTSRILILSRKQFSECKGDHLDHRKTDLGRYVAAVNPLPRALVMLSTALEEQ